MYQTFTIKGFRGFRDITLGPLERVNLITGKNNVGKTAILEALFLHHGAGNPDVPRRLNGLRGIQKLAMNADEVWGWMFLNRNVTAPIELASQEHTGGTVVRIHLAGPSRGDRLQPVNGENEPTKIIGSETTTTGLHELVVSSEDASGQVFTARASILGNEIRMETDAVVQKGVGIFLGTRRYMPDEDAKRLTDLDLSTQDKIMTVLQLVEPRLRRLGVRVTGAGPVAAGDVGIGELLPIQFMGEGTARLLTQLVATYAAKDGVVLLDEVENGLHYSIMGRVWTAIADAARESPTQVFATTHSWDCVRAAHEAFERSGSYDFRLHRLDRVGDEVRAVTYDQEMLAAAIESGLEVR